METLPANLDISQFPTSYSVNSNEDLIKINAMLRGIKQLKKKVTDELDPEIDKANKAHKGLTALKKKHLEPLEAIEYQINDSIKSWAIKQEEEARILQQKINEQLANQAEEEKKRILDSATDEWSKEIFYEKVKAMVPVTVDIKDCKETVAPKVEGQYKRSNWKAKVIDEELIPRCWLMPNMPLLEKRAKELKIEGMTIPGVEFYDDFTIVTKI